MFRDFFDGLEEMVVDTAMNAPWGREKRMAEAVRDATHIFLRNINDQSIVNDPDEASIRLAAVMKAAAWLMALNVFIMSGKGQQPLAQDEVFAKLKEMALEVVPLLGKMIGPWIGAGNAQGRH